MSHEDTKEEKNFCPNCDKEFQRNAQGRAAKFCSPECKYEYERKQYKLKHPKELKTLICGYCNKPF